MVGAVSSFPYVGILVILLMTMTLEADALTAWDCSRDGLETRTVYLKDLSEGEKALVEGMRTLGVQYPDEFAYKIKREPGYTAIMEEDKIHIVQCEPVVALLLPQDKCYDRLQIVYHDNIYFLTPWTHIITETANEIPCNAPNLQDYELEGSMYKIVPRIGVSLEPRRDKNFEEDPENSSPKYKETEHRRRRNIGGIEDMDINDKIRLISRHFPLGSVGLDFTRKPYLPQGQLVVRHTEADGYGKSRVGNVLIIILGILSIFLVVLVRCIKCGSAS